MKIRAEQRQNTVLNLFWIAFAFFITNSLTQYALSSTANLDQSEQLVFSQNWQLGYSSQPPLYTWLINCLFSITGPSLLILAGFKVILLSALIGLLIGIGKQLAFTTEQQLTSLMGLAFIPQYIWESQRDITHSLLATVLAAATLLQVMRTRLNPSISNYIIAGFLAAMGIISKYNYAIFYLALIITAALSLQYRQTILNYRSLISIGVAVVLVAPHGIWALNNIDIASSSVHKFNVAEGHYLAGVIDALLSLLNFLTPLWIISLVLIKDGFQLFNTNQQDERSFIANLFVITMTIVLLMMLLSGAQNLKVRWYQPLLFYIPLLLALNTSPTQKNLKIYCAIGTFVLVTVAIALPSRILFAESLGNKSRANLPYQDQAMNLANLIGEPEAIFSETNLIGGNMRLFFKSAQIITPDYDRQLFNQRGNKLILCETKNCQNKKFQDWILNRHKININFLKFNKLENSYNHISNRKHIFYWAKVE